MFLKRCTRKKNGKGHVYWQLVESVRTARGSRHRVVAYLGELSASERRGWGRLGTALDGKASSKAQQLALFEPGLEEGEAVPETIEVDLKGVRVSGSRDFGEIFLALTLWRVLGLDTLLAEAIDPGREAVPWDRMACLLAISRLVEPDSELHVSDTWYGRTSLGELLGIPTDRVDDNRLYRTLDKVLPLKSAIESHLKARGGELFSPDFDLLLYDVTSTYFEGLADGNAQAQRGYRRDHRPGGDARRFSLGV